MGMFGSGMLGTFACAKRVSPSRQATCRHSETFVPFFECRMVLLGRASFQAQTRLRDVPHERATGSVCEFRVVSGRAARNEHASLIDFDRRLQTDDYRPGG